MKNRILLFDDRQENRDQVRSALVEAFGGQGSVIDFVPGVGGVKEGTYEIRLISDLRSEPNQPVDLIVADSDLSSLEPYRGLSENIVKVVANSIGIPECAYARGEANDAEDFLRRGEQREGCIRLTFKPDVARFAQRVVGIANGFKCINEQLILLESAGRQTPGKLLATILGKPEYADKISLYASGDQSRLENILRAKGNKEEYMRRLTCLLGYWLWDSVLRFPGVTVGQIPAASYLDIKPEFFMKDEVQAVFSTALYNGPFASAKVKMWWRGMLDDLVAKNRCNSGRELITKILKIEVPPSQCCDDPSISAGYYCMLRQLPVCQKNSKAGLPWFPRGADLARVSNSAHEELGPWL